MPTDQEWGRLYKFNTTGDSGLIMPPRSYYFRPFVPGQWTDLAIGMIFATCGNSGDTSNLNDERLASSTPANLFHFGLSSALPTNKINVATNPFFAGLRGIIGSTHQLLATTKLLTFNSATLVNGGGTAMNGGAHSITLTQGVTATPFNMIGLRFIHDPVAGVLYMNRGASNGIALADDDANITTLEAFLLALSNNIVTPDATFALSTTANFKTFYTYWPYLLNRLKLHCVGAIKLG